MLTQQDLNMIESMMVKVVGTALTANNEEMKAYIDERFEKNNAEMKAYIEERLVLNNEEMKDFVRDHVKEVVHDSESFLLDEIDRFYNFAKRDIQKLMAKVEENRHVLAM